MELQAYILKVMNNARVAGATGDVNFECYLDERARVVSFNSGTRVSFTLHIGDKHAEA